MVSSQPLVSIVVPLYNNRTHIAECLESVRSQTHPHWECVVVNNCSTDGSAEIAREFASRDPRIRVHDNSEFLPALANHNESVRRMSAASRYCKIVFGDDWIFPECLTRMVEVAEAHPRVGIVGAYRLEGRDVTCTGLPYATTVFEGRAVCRDHLLNGVHVFGSANSLLFRADLMRQQASFFNERNIHADTEACFALLRAHDFGFVHQVLTYTRLREDSMREASYDLHTAMAGRLRLLVKYGPAFLTAEELKAELSTHTRRYYRTLGKAVLLGRDRSYWQYHRAKMADCGVAMSSGRVTLGIADALGQAALHPWKALTVLRRRLTQVVFLKMPKHRRSVRTPGLS